MLQITDIDKINSLLAIRRQIRMHTKRTIRMEPQHTPAALAIAGVLGEAESGHGLDFSAVLNRFGEADQAAHLLAHVSIIELIDAELGKMGVSPGQMDMPFTGPVADDGGYIVPKGMHAAIMEILRGKSFIRGEPVDQRRG